MYQNESKIKTVTEYYSVNFLITKIGLYFSNRWMKGKINEPKRKIISLGNCVLCILKLNEVF